jgi:hypothetical protein
VQIQHRNIDVIEEFAIVLDRSAAREEYNDLLLEVFPQEREKE